MKKNLLFTILAAGAVICSCAKNEKVSDNYLDETSVSNEGTPISFDNYTFTSVQTKGTAITTDFLKTEGIGLFAFYQAGNDTAKRPEFSLSRYPSPDFMNNVELKYVAGPTGENDWAYTPLRYWPVKTDLLSFFAYAPYTKGMTWEELGIHQLNDTSFVQAVRIPTYPKEQMDRLVFTPVLDTNLIGKTNEKINLNAKHALCKVGLSLTGVTELTGAKVSLNKVTLKGVYAQASVAFGKKGSLNVKGTGGFQNVSLSLADSCLKPAAKNITEAITQLNEDDAFMFLAPQKLASDSIRMEIEYIVSYKDPVMYRTTTSTVVLKTTELKQGNAYNIAIKFGKFIGGAIEFDAVVTKFDDGGSVN